jgi:acyl-CoA thioesterase-1
MRFLPVLPILAVAVVSLAGCRANNPPATPRVDAVKQAAPQTADTRPLDTRPIVACFGDSLTAGFGADDGQSYPDFLQKDLDAGGYRYRVVNEGISGNTTKDGVDRLTEVIALHPAVVVLEFGGNDGLRGLQVETTRANLAHMIEALKTAGAKVVLAGITLPPDYGPDYVAAFTANYPTLAKKYSLPLLPFLLDHVYGVPGLMQADNTHATDRGNEIVARNVLPLVEPLLKK